MHSTSTELKLASENHHHHDDDDSPAPKESCRHDPGILPPDDNVLQVRRGRKGFPSYWDYYNSAGGDPIVVSYDRRSLFLNADRALFLGGSLHPVRATRATWELALDEAVRNGLNLVTIYVFWAAHQPFKDQQLDWKLNNFAIKEQQHDATTTTMLQDGGDWELADAIWSCARRGLFVHIRVGPYVCAEYSYGGIPEWLPVQQQQQHPDISMRMRRLDPLWMKAMEEFVAAAFDYLAANKLWAHQNGPIIMAQIENELGEDNENTEFMQDNNLSNKTVSNGTASIQAYADWCGTMAAKHAPPNTLITMCNGLSANNTVATHNGDSQFIYWLEQKGDNGRIQEDQPALWTEDEGGFQLWGEDSAHPTDYFWGHTARYMARTALQWFARGGSHLNYYMVSCFYVFFCRVIETRRLSNCFCMGQWWGGYNRGRSAAAGIMNAYATDVLLCSSGQRHQPKFDHLQALHEALADVASILLESPSALFRNKTVDVLNKDGIWEPGNHQTMFVYQSFYGEAIIVENNGDAKSIVRVPVSTSTDETKVLNMAPNSAILTASGAVLFDSALINPSAKSFARVREYDPVLLQNWTYWNEPIGIPDASSAISAGAPVEQTKLAVLQNTSSDYAWYQTSFNLSSRLEEATFHLDAQKANGFLVFVDGMFIGAVDNHEHGEGGVKLAILSSRPLAEGNHVVAILSVSLGYYNLIGRWAGNVGPKLKGLTGDIVLSSPQLLQNRSLIDGRAWLSQSGLRGVNKNNLCVSEPDQEGPRPMWSSAFFRTPSYDPKTKGLFVEIPSGRGHFYLNARDLGRFWNITRPRSGDPSMEFYFLPPDYLSTNRSLLNQLRVFDEYGGSLRTPRLLLSWLEVAPTPRFPDVIDFGEACM